MAAGSEQGDGAAVRFGNVADQEAEMIIPQPDFTFRDVGDINELLEVKISPRLSAGNPAPHFARQRPQLADQKTAALLGFEPQEITQPVKYIPGKIESYR